MKKTINKDAIINELKSIDERLIPNKIYRNYLPYYNSMSICLNYDSLRVAIYAENRFVIHSCNEDKMVYRYVYDSAGSSDILDLLFLLYNNKNKIIEIVLKNYK